MTSRLIFRLWLSNRKCYLSCKLWSELREFWVWGTSWSARVGAFFRLDILCPVKKNGGGGGRSQPGLHSKSSGPRCTPPRASPQPQQPRVCLHARGASAGLRLFVSSGEGPGAALFRFRVGPCVGPLAASALLQDNGACLPRLVVYLSRLVEVRPGHSPQKPPTPNPAYGAISLAE